MEIRTRHDQRTAREPAPARVPDGSRYLRRKPAQKVRRSRLAAGTLIRGLRLSARAAAVGALTGGIVMAVVYALSSESFSLKEVSVSGCRYSDPAVIEAVVRREFSGHLLKIGLREVRDRLERETWVRQVDVRRILPSTLALYVTERTPAVIFELNGQLMVADREAVVLDRYNPAYGKLDVPVFRGLAEGDRGSPRALSVENEARLRLGIKLLDELESGSPALARNISEVDLSDPANVKVLLVDDTTEIFLGDREFLKRLGTFIDNLSHYRELKSQYQEIASVDMRFEGQIVYRPVLDVEQPAAETVTASNSVPPR